MSDPPTLLFLNAPSLVPSSSLTMDDGWIATISSSKAFQPSKRLMRLVYHRSNSFARSTTIGSTDGTKTAYVIVWRSISRFVPAKEVLKTQLLLKTRTRLQYHPILIRARNKNNPSSTLCNRMCILADASWIEYIDTRTRGRLLVSRNKGSRVHKSKSKY